MSAPRWRMEWLCQLFDVPERRKRKLYRVYMGALFSKKGVKLQAKDDGSFDEFLRQRAEKAGLLRKRKAGGRAQ